MPATRPAISAEMMVDEVMTAYRATIGVFIRRRMLCIGCPFGTLHSLRHACAEHGLDLDRILAEVVAAAAEPAELS